MKRGFVVPPDMFGLRGRCADFDAAERELGPIPRHKRPVRIAEEEIYFYRLPVVGESLWPTTGQFLKFNISVIASGTAIALEDEPNQG